MRLFNSTYIDRGEKKETRWIWEAEEIIGFSAYKEKSLQDKSSVFLGSQSSWMKGNVTSG
ncbi:hypothetical protein GCM10020331_073710 [Ectobacillus funiculus]